MFARCTSVICTTLLLCCIFLTSCTSGPGTTASSTPGATSTAKPTATLPPPATATTPALTTAPAHYTTHTLLRGIGRPDDLIMDKEGHLLFSDFFHGTVSRINADGTVTVVLRNIAGPEGMAVLPDNTLLIAEQTTHRILAYTPGDAAPHVLRALPGMPSKARCKEGVDGVTYDPTTNTLIVPDSPTGEVYRMSIDGKTLTLLASGMARPVGAIVDTHGTIYVADECGGAIWSITPNGKTTHIGGFGMPDDVIVDTHGNLLVIDLAPAIHALIRFNLATGKRETLARQGFIEPQGLAIDERDHIFVSDDFANTVVEFIPA